MNMPTLQPDPIEQLRDERPVVGSSMPLAVLDARPLLVRSRRPRGIRIALVAAAACAVVLSGVVVSGRWSEDPSTAIGISTAEARTIAFDSLKQLSELQRFEAEAVLTAREADGKQRTEESVVRVQKADGNYRLDRTWRSDFADRDANGLTDLYIDGLHLEEAASSRFPQDWMLVATSAGARRPSLGPSQKLLLTPPDFSHIVTQLERERLVTARRDNDGTVIVEIRTDASTLVPVGDVSSRSPDPIASFAQTIKIGSNMRRIEAPIEIRIEVHDDGTRRIEASGDIEREYANGAGGTQPIRSRLTARWTWREVQDLRIAMPAPTDVLVVGRVSATRKGETGPEGPHGTLADYTPAELRALGRRIESHRRRTTLAGVRKERAATRRRHPELWDASARYHEARQAEIERDWLPIDRTAMSRTEGCSPFWPDSNRAMDPQIARSDPEQAGWRCELQASRSSFSVMPGEEQIDVRRVQSDVPSAWTMPSR